MRKARRATHFSATYPARKSGSMATATPSPEYTIIEDSAGVQHVSLRDDSVG